MKKGNERDGGSEGGRERERELEIKRTRWRYAPSSMSLKTFACSDARDCRFSATKVPEPKRTAVVTSSYGVAS